MVPDNMYKMGNTLRFILMLFCLLGVNPLFAQEVEKIAPVQIEMGEHIQFIDENVETFQDKVFNKIDSLSSKSSDFIQNATDSLNQLSIKLEGKVQSKIDSLNQTLIDIKSIGEKQLTNASKKADKIISRIDSLQNLLTNKLHLDKLEKYGSSGTDLVEKLNVPALNNKSIPPVRRDGDLEKLNLPGMKGLNTKIPGMDKLSLPDNGPGSLRSLVDERLGKLSNLKDNEWFKQDLPNANIPDKVQERLQAGQEYGQVLKDPSKIDQAFDTKAAQMTEAQYLTDQTKELDALKELPESMLADLKRYRDAQALKAEAKVMAVKKATDYFARHQDKLTEAQGMMSKLKKKYSYVPDSRDLSTAVKATSLKNEPLKKRLVFGLGFQIQRTNPISLDLSPNLLYRFNKLFSAGISGTYRASLGIENNSSVAVKTAQDVYGASAIAQHKVWKGFFGHGEFQYLSTPMVDPATGTDLPTRSWHEGLLLGIGKQINFSKALNGQIIFTYDFLHTSASPNPKAWNIKFGFQLGKFKLKDIKL